MLIIIVAKFGWNKIPFNVFPRLNMVWNLEYQYYNTFTILFTITFISKTLKQFLKSGVHINTLLLFF